MANVVPPAAPRVPRLTVESSVHPFLLWFTNDALGEVEPIPRGHESNAKSVGTLFLNTNISITLTRERAERYYVVYNNLTSDSRMFQRDIRAQ